ncbi:MAG: hypothetical protein LN546_03395 [Rickettsia endosymbiont of Ecitomorpha arachnoides]|nr:hypothetical protein [Rickettsia endosymbiont of Ecitomorpha arachnoides]
MSTEDTEKSIKERTKFNKVGKQISESEHQATHNVLNTPKRKQAEVNKPYQDFTPFSESNPKQELKRSHQGYASSIETPAPKTKPISTKPPQVVAKNLNVASKNPVTAIAQKLINKFTTGNKPMHKTKQSPTPSANPTNKSTGKGQGNIR